MKLKCFIGKHSDFTMRWSHKEDTRKTWSNHFNNQNTLNKQSMFSWKTLKIFRKQCTGSAKLNKLNFENIL